MRTAKSVALRNVLRAFAICLGVMTGLAPLASTVRAANGCGPLVGGGTSCPPATNAAPITATLAMPGSDTAAVISLTLVRGTEDSRADPTGTPPRVRVETRDDPAGSPQPPTLEERGYALAAQTQRQDGRVLVYENPNVPGWPGGGVMIILVRPGQPPAPTGRIRTGGQPASTRCSRLGRPRSTQSRASAFPIFKCRPTPQQAWRIYRPGSGCRFNKDSSIPRGA